MIETLATTLAYFVFVLFVFWLVLNLARCTWDGRFKDFLTDLYLWFRRTIY